MCDRMMRLKREIPHRVGVGSIGMYGPKGYGFSAILILADLAILVVWFLFSSLDMGVFLRRSHFFIIIKEETFTNYVYGNLTLV